MPRCLLALTLALGLAAQSAAAQARDTPYAGFEARSISSLSQEDLDALGRGEGWGLALPAELNGRPGPAHLLELREDLGLTDDQVRAITELRDAMRTEAIAAGARFVAAEAAVDAALADPGLTAPTLQRLVEEAGLARAALRMVHLSRHLDTPPLLTAHQIALYQTLRGYGGDPCAAPPPEGHDPAMWRRHNGCD